MTGHRPGWRVPIGSAHGPVPDNVTTHPGVSRQCGGRMRIVIFGASGATGRVLVTQALAQGHNVTGFVRTPSKFRLTHPLLTMVQGDVADVVAVERALGGQDAVLCALGARTPLKRDPILVQGIQDMVTLMEGSGPRRLIYLSFLGVHDGREQLSPLGRYVVAPLLMRNVVADHEAKERIIARSGLDWTIVRPPRLTNGAHTGTYRHGDDIHAASVVPLISRADLADFMLRQLDSAAYVHKTPAVMH